MMFYMENRTNGIDTREFVIGLRTPVKKQSARKAVFAAMFIVAVFIGFMHLVMP